MINSAYQIIRTIRPRQWLKNLAVFAAPIFHGIIFDGDVFWRSTLAFFAFTLLVSGIYIFNDLSDVEKDKQHPIKKNRPIASGKLSKKTAKIMVVLFYLAGFSLSYFYVGTFFSIVGLTYVLLQTSYSLYFRNIIILDALIVSTGFIMRVFAGGLAVDVSISSWLVLTTIGLSLLLAFGKRRSEKTLLSDIVEKKTRNTLQHYPDALLDSIISMSSSFCILSYALFTFQTSPRNESALSDLLPSILKAPKWMMLTIPLVIYGVARYLYVIYEKKEGESPERVLLSDKPLFTTVLLWGIAILLIIYVLPN